MRGRFALNTVSYDEALRIQKEGFPAGVYRLRADILNPELDQGKAEAWYQRSVLMKGTIFLVRYDKTKEGKERLHIRVRGQMPWITSLSRPALLQSLLRDIERLTGKTDLEAQLELMGLYRLDILEVLIAKGWSATEIGELLGKAKRRAENRQAAEKRKAVRLEKLRQRGEPSLRGESGPQEKASPRAPNDVTRPLRSIPQTSKSPAPKSLNTRVFTNSVHQALSDLTDIGGAPLKLQPSGSTDTLQVNTAAIEAVEVVERSAEVLDTSPTKLDLPLPTPSMTVRHRPSETLLQELAMPKGEDE